MGELKEELARLRHGNTEEVCDHVVRLENNVRPLSEQPHGRPPDHGALPEVLGTSSTITIEDPSIGTTKNELINKLETIPETNSTTMEDSQRDDHNLFDGESIFDDSGESVVQLGKNVNSSIETGKETGSDVHVGHKVSGDLTGIEHVASVLGASLRDIPFEDLRSQTLTNVIEEFPKEWREELRRLVEQEF